MRALIATNHMNSFSGSEIVALEVAECLENSGYEVEVICNYTSKRFQNKLKASFSITDQKISSRFDDYDFVWNQHNVCSSYEILRKLFDGTSSTRLVSAVLSPYELFEHTGLTSSILCGAHLVVNSSETQKKIASLGIPVEQLHNFMNAAPRRFFNPKPKVRTNLHKLLIVSNHLPEELQNAIPSIKSSGVSVEVVGKQYAQRRIVRGDLDEVDAVISIGKTAQYCILSGTPFYCYDRFGGPGWLNEANFIKARNLNFSGRCTHRKLHQRDIVNELIGGFSNGASSIGEIQDKFANEFFLEDFIDKTMQLPRPVYDINKLQEFFLHSNMANASIIGRYYRKSMLQGQQGKFKTIQNLLRKAFS